MIESMFHLHQPILEKILRPVIVYIFLVLLLRLFGKRELAQLNPFDLVVLLSLSNTVQNAIIGDDNSVSGGIIGAFALLAINWALAHLLFRMPKLNRALEGGETVLIRQRKSEPKGAAAGDADGTGTAVRTAQAGGERPFTRWRSACWSRMGRSTLSRCRLLALIISARR